MDAHSHECQDAEYDRSLSFSEQARSLELCRDYSLENPLESTKTRTPSEAVQLDLTDPPGLSTAAFLDMLRDTITDEKWDIDRESTDLLAEVATTDKHPRIPWDADGSRVPFRDLKIMEPVLTTDHELDLQRLEARNTATISMNGMEPVPVDVERDEGLQWPSRYACLPLDFDCQLATARLDIGKDVVDYLRNIAQPTFMNERELMDSVLELGKVITFYDHEGLCTTDTSVECAAKPNHTAVAATVAPAQSRSPAKDAAGDGAHFRTRRPAWFRSSRDRATSNGSR